MISKYDFQSNIIALKTTTKENAKKALEKQIDTAIRAHTADIVTANSRGAASPGERVVVHVSSEVGSDLSVFEHLGGSLRDLLDPYLAAGWIIERDGQRSQQEFLSDGPIIDIRVVYAVSSNSD